MGYTWEDDDPNDEGNTGQQNAGLPEPARKHLAKLEKANKELTAQLAELAKQSRTKTVEETVKNKGYDPKVASFIPETLTDSAAVEKWLEDHGGMFVKAGQQQQPPEDAGSTFPPEMMAQFAAIQNVTGSAVQPTKWQNLEAQINATQNIEELQKLWQTAFPGGATLT